MLKSQLANLVTHFPMLLYQHQWQLLPAKSN